jgi:hypothetical protein
MINQPKRTSAFLDFRTGLLRTKELLVRGTIGITYDAEIREAVNPRENLLRHLRNILCVAIWGSFETYLQHMLKEFYEKNPDALSPEKSVSYEEAIRNRDNIMTFIIDKEVDYFGRLPFQEMKRYLGNRVKYQIQQEVSIIS